MKAYLIRYGEIWLKGPLIRSRFERKLAENIEKMFFRRGMECIVDLMHGRILVHTNEDAKDVLSKVFGIVSFSEVACTSSDIDDICRTAVEISLKKKSKTFAIRARRVGKHDYTSLDLAVKCGAVVRDATGMKVNLSMPELTIYIDVRHSMAYIYTDIIPGAGGMPMGTQGKVCAVVRNARDLIAAFLMMKRGCDLIVMDGGMSIEPLQPWCGDDIKTVKEEKKSFESWIGIAKRNRCHALVLGDDLDTIKKMRKRMSFPVFLPLIGYEEKDLRRMADMLGVRKEYELCDPLRDIKCH